MDCLRPLLATIAVAIPVGILFYFMYKLFEFVLVVGLRAHELKVIEPYFSDFYRGVKTFEIRINDRHFKVGDYLIIRQWVENRYTGKRLIVKVTCITDYAQKEGYVVMGFKKICK